MKYTITLLTLLSAAPASFAGSCGFHGYSSRGYWPGGYWSGGGGYSAGYYAPGYYKTYSYYEEPVFIKFKAVVPLVELPTYGAYVVQPPPVAAPGHPAAAPAMPTPAAAAGATDSKLDEIISLTKQNLSRTASLESRMSAVEERVGIARPPATPSATPKAPAETAKDAPDGPTVLYNRCASCHEAKSAPTLGKNVVLFVTTAEGPEMAGVGADGKPEVLSQAVLKKVEKELAGKTMPPESGKDGKPVPAMPEAERKVALDFIRRVLAGPLK